MQRVPLVTAVLTAAFCPAAPGQSGGADGDLQKRLERQMRERDKAWRTDTPAGATLADRLLLDWGGSASFSLSGIDDAGGTPHTLRQSDGRAWLRADLDGSQRVYGRLKFRYDDWNTGDDFDGEGDDLREPIGERWWYELKLDHADLKVGKQFIDWGNGLALSNHLIGATLEADLGPAALTLVIGDTPANDFVDFDASRPHFDTNTKRRFVGALLETSGGEPTAFLHVLRQIDRNDRDSGLFVDGLGQLYSVDFDYDSTYFGVGGHGSLGGTMSWRAELDFETGRALSSPISAAGSPQTQTREDLCGWAFDTGVSWAGNDAAKTRVDLGLAVASGDDDRLDSADTFGGNLSGTDDTSFNSFGFIDTGVALAPDPGNLVILHLGGESSPLWSKGPEWARLRAVVDGYFFAKLDSDAPINVATTADRVVGGEIDVGFDWSLLSDLSLNFRYGLFIPGKAMPPGEDGARQLLYGGVTYAF